MQFKVPQDVQREDRIVGPLTLRQLIICGIGGSIAYGVFTTLGRDYIWITWAPPIAIITLITIVFAFINPLNLNFERFILFWLEFKLLPQKRFWIQGSADPLSSTYTASVNKEQKKIENKAKTKAEQYEEKKQKIKNLTDILDHKS